MTTLLLCGGAVAFLAYVTLLLCIYLKARKIVCGKDDEILNLRSGLAEMMEGFELLCVTCDRVSPYPAMTVYAISPGGAVEVLYVEDKLFIASTTFPSASLADMGADMVIYPINQCFANKQLADVLANTRRQEFEGEDYED